MDQPHLVIDFIVKRLTPGGPNHIHNPGPPHVNAIIVNRLTPGGPNPINNYGPPPVNDFIVKRLTPRGPNHIHNLCPSPINDFFVKCSYGNHGRKKKKVQFSTREFAGAGRSTGYVGKKLRQKHPSRRQVELVETELRKMKVEICESTESVTAATTEANQAEFNLQVLLKTKNELMDKLLEMKAMEAFFMGFL
ncbi:hypothetical protein V6N13_073474 [Hibiscus sabdariffa]|uniref:Uncharacterized protein n=2 Tax=Hibiscus sabdariffa TaxID=183260 RepID=A0ABR1ZUS5_9ROSI